MRNPALETPELEMIEFISCYPFSPVSFLFCSPYPVLSFSPYLVLSCFPHPFVYHVFRILCIIFSPYPFVSFCVPYPLYHFFLRTLFYLFYSVSCLSLFPVSRLSFCSRIFLFIICSRIPLYPFSLYPVYHFPPYPFDPLFPHPFYPFSRIRVILVSVSC